MTTRPALQQRATRPATSSTQPKRQATRQATRQTRRTPVALAAQTPVEAEQAVERIPLTYDTRLLVTPTEAARRLSIGRSLLYKLMRQGELTYILVGEARRIPVAALDAFIATQLLAQGMAIPMIPTMRGQTISQRGEAL